MSSHRSKNSLNTNFQKGFGLLEVVIAASIMSAIGLAFATMISQMNGTVGYIEDRSAALDLKHIMTLDLSSSQACVNSFGGLNVVANQNVPNLKNTTNVVSYTNNQVYDRINFNGFRLQNVNVPLAPNSTGRMNLVVDLTRQRTAGPNSLKPQTIPLQVTSNATGRISDCVAIGEGAAMNDTAGQCDGYPPGTAPAKSGGLGCTFMANCISGKAPFSEGSTVTSSKQASSHTDGYTNKYLCINKKWVLYESSTQSSKL